ncbi:MAG: carboxylesterase family protein [Sphaerochaetaceae bacterium]|nr:carboxylesterase family protein [Sphaerochaetaceae bacterium]
MRKKIRVEDFLVSILAAIGYGLGYGIPAYFNYSVLICLVSCLVLGGVLNSIGNAVIKTKWAKKSQKRKRILVLAIIALFLLVAIFAKEVLHYSILEDLSIELMEGTIGASIAGFVLSIIITAIKTKQLKSRFKDGSAGHTMSEEELKIIESLKGENEEIKGDYDEALAVKTENGIFIGKKEKNIQSFLGIPYAKPPVGNLRWKAPQKPEPSDKIWQAHHFGASAIQSDSHSISLKTYTQSEDCLTLNVWRSVDKKNSDKLKPVLMYIHGGNLAFGGSAEPIYNGKSFVKAFPEVIVVTINYRLGIFGFVNNKGIDVPEEYKDSGNLGLLDQMMALKWVHNNIQSFGGDPNNIMLAGDTLGAYCVKIMSTLKETNKLFKKALLISNVTVSSEKDNELPRMNFKDIMNKFGAKTFDELINIPSDQLKQYQKERINDVWYQPFKDGRLIKKYVDQAIEDGDSGDIEFIYGIPTNEISSWITISNEEKMFTYSKDTLSDLLKTSSAEEVEKIKESLEYYKENGETEEVAIKKTVEFWLYEFSSLRNCLALSRLGKTVRCFLWDIESPIEKLGGNSMSAIGTLLGNNEQLENLGYLVNNLVTEVFQGLISNDLRYDSPELKYDEVKGVDALKWKSFSEEGPAILHITNSEVKNEEKVLKEEIDLIKNWNKV